MRPLAWLIPLPLLAAPATPPAHVVPEARTAWLVLPEAVAPAALQTGLASDASSWLVLDVRAAQAWRDYHVPGAEHVDLDALPERLRAVPRATRVVLVDRDGTQAYAVAGAAQVALGAAAPNICVLAGGTLRWWREIEHPTRATTNPGVSPARPAAPADARPTNPLPRPRSAGC